MWRRLADRVVFERWRHVSQVAHRYRQTPQPSASNVILREGIKASAHDLLVPLMLLWIGDTSI
jgi:hypothetical protein